MSDQDLQVLNDIKLNYDKEHDILYIYFGEPRISYDEEMAPGIFVRYSEKDDAVTGLIVMDYKKKNKHNIQKHIPININFNNINDLIN